MDPILYHTAIKCFPENGDKLQTFKSLDATIHRVIKFVAHKKCETLLFYFECVEKLGLKIKTILWFDVAETREKRQSFMS